jgi:glycosyltransferase involved in cell wall biosynthesis
MQHSNISLIGFFLSSSGLGRAARNIAHSLSSTTHTFSCINIKDKGTGGDNEFASKCSNYLPDKINFVISGIVLAELLSGQISRLGSGKKNYFYPYWELDRIPSDVVKAVATFDKVIAPSQFIADTLQKYVDYKVSVINQPVLMPQHISINKLEDGVLRIFSMMDFGSFIDRKNPRGAIEAFQMAFPPNVNNVELIIKIKGNRDLGFRNELILCCSKDSRIKVIDGDISTKDIAILTNKCNVFLSLHRSEGFGFGPAEAMASGKIVVATQYGGVTDFLNKSTGYPISYKMVMVQKGEYLHGENQMWADPTLSHAASELQEIYKNFDQAVQRANKGRQLMMNKFSFESVGIQLQNFFDLN